MQEEALVFVREFSGDLSEERVWREVFSEQAICIHRGGCGDKRGGGDFAVCSTNKAD